MKHLGGRKKTGPPPPAPLPAGNLPKEPAVSPHTDPRRLKAVTRAKGGEPTLRSLHTHSGLACSRGRSSSPARSGSGLTTKMAAQPAQIRRNSPPAGAAAAAAPRPRRGPARNEKPIYPSLSLCCFLAYITINARPVSVCRGRGESGRERRAGKRAGGGRAAAPAPGPGAPSATLSTSPLLAPALPGHLPPSTPRSLSARAAAPTIRRQRRTGGEGGKKTRPAQL